MARSAAGRGAALSPLGRVRVGRGVLGGGPERPPGPACLSLAARRGAARLGAGPGERVRLGESVQGFALRAGQRWRSAAAQGRDGGGGVDRAVLGLARGEGPGGHSRVSGARLALSVRDVVAARHAFVFLGKLQKLVAVISGAFGGFPDLSQCLSSSC